MSSPVDRKKQLLGVLLVVWALLVVYRVATQEEPKRAPLKYVKGQTVSRSEVAPRAPSGMTVQLDRLKDRPGITLGNPKNIFASLQTWIAPPPPPPAPPPLPSPPPPPTPEELAREQARRDLSQFRYLGYLNKGLGQDQAFLARERELFIVGKGQIVFGSIYLKEVTSSFVILQEKNTQLEITLTISGG